MSDRHIIGRQPEIKILAKLLKSPKAELLAIYGRRRVGKTFLINNYYKDTLIFSCTGQYKGKTQEQLFNFTEKLNQWFKDVRIKIPPKTWQEAFILLKDCLEHQGKKRKRAIFFDELPWLDNHKSGFLSSFSYFWNSYAAEQPNLIVVICGSAASWMIDKIVNDKGGLHNRITQKIRLLPFSLAETKDFLISKNIKIDNYQVLQLYMAIGGIPTYLDAVERGKSAAQNIEEMCFIRNGALTDEFENLYTSLYNNPEHHIQVVRSLAAKNKGLTRSEILENANLLTGGTISSVINELTESGFIEKIYPFANKEKDSLYRLSDEFSLFYFKFMRNQKGYERGQWLSKQQSPNYISWCGYAFESICLKHVTQIKTALKIGGVSSGASSWIKAGSENDKGAQIDLIIDRADNSINICEIKFSTSPYMITKKYSGEIENKLESFLNSTKTKKSLFLTFITTYGVSDNAHKEQLVDFEITMDALFH